MSKLSIFALVSLCLMSAVAAASQTLIPEDLSKVAASADKTAVAEKPNSVVIAPSKLQATPMPTPVPSPTPEMSDDATVDPDSWYVRPTLHKRTMRYVKSVIGPVALAKYAGSAGIASWRVTPSEWGDHWSGFGRRYANSLGKSAISNTTIYGLDTAMKLDSTFYPSRDRSVTARLRNSIFSPFTARNARGKRVFGLPRNAGEFTSAIVSTEVWYPKRIDVWHGVKGGVISLALNAGFNIFKEFVWKKK